MAEFGGVVCTFVKGAIPRPMVEAITIYAVPGIDGVGVHRQGKRGQEFGVTLVVYGTIAQVQLWIADIAALQGTTIGYIDDNGLSSGDVLAVSMGAPQLTNASTPDSPNQKRCQIVFNVQPLTS